jgi:hypothetical protein
VYSLGTTDKVARNFTGNYWQGSRELLAKESTELHWELLAKDSRELHWELLAR